METVRAGVAVAAVNGQCHKCNLRNFRLGWSAKCGGTYECKNRADHLGWGNLNYIVTVFSTARESEVRGSFFGSLPKLCNVCPPESQQKVSQEARNEFK